MSYLVLARKWRPLIFADVIGQQHVTTTLENAIKTQRIANAYLFSGPRGVGKTTVARILAKAINCDQGPTPVPCNQCDNCREIIDGHSLNVFEVDGASNRGIDEVRNLRENLRYVPAKGKYKIYIIDEVHMLTSEAFNALLKTLEEPPKNVLFIFATTEPHKIPATILSRCQHFTFKRLSVKQIIEQLEIICTGEQIKIDAESLQIIARKSDGCMRDAESVLDQAYSFCGNTIQYLQLINLLGIINIELLFLLSTCIQNRDVKGVLNLIDTIFLEGYDLTEFLINAADHFRNLLVARVTQSVAQIAVSDMMAQRYLNEAEHFHEDDLLRYIKIITETEYAIKRSPNPRLKLEFALLKMVKMEGTVQLADLLHRIETIQVAPLADAISQQAAFLPNRVKENPSPRPIYRPQPQLTLEDRKAEIAATLASDVKPVVVPAHSELSAVQTGPVIDLTAITGKWGQIIEMIRLKKIAVAAFMNEGVPAAIHENVLEIMFGKDNGFHMDSIMKNRSLIEQIITEVLGVSLRIKCIKGDLKPVRPAPEKPTPEVTRVAAPEVPPAVEIMSEIMTAFEGEYVA